MKAWCTDCNPLTTHNPLEELREHFKDCPVEGICLFYKDRNNTLLLQVIFGLQKYASDPDDPNYSLFEEDYG